MTRRVVRRAVETLTRPEPGATRANEYQTSFDAADKIRYRKGSHKLRLLEAYLRAGRAGLTNDDAGMQSGLFDVRACYWKRCDELRDAGLIAWTGGSRVSEWSGAEQGVSTITRLGKSVAALHGLRTKNG